MSKRVLFIVISVIVVAVVSSLFIIQGREITYREALEEFFPNGKIDEIYILHLNPDEHLHVKITDENEISRLVDELSNVKLKKISNGRLGLLNYYVTLTSNSESLQMVVTDVGYIQIRDKDYKIIGDNLLEKVISNLEMEPLF
ncbi:hypothetical protein [Bacillus alkalisoli]|uniref:hypothetical protein n=1 Tax=Bacillus alkalisoli TaxID=2011008 RepID=UPI000C232BD7|nr:hypothetical protein [Bacillus alkalisoli]